MKDSPAIERPTRNAGRHAECIQADFRVQRHIQVAEKVKQYLSGCVPVDEKYMGHNK